MKYLDITNTFYLTLLHMIIFSSLKLQLIFSCIWCLFLLFVSFHSTTLNLNILCVSINSYHHYCWTTPFCMRLFNSLFKQIVSRPSFKLLVKFSVTLHNLLSVSCWHSRRTDFLRPTGRVKQVNAVAHIMHKNSEKHM